MSDSDDTDILLLIPPDFFNAAQTTSSVTPVPPPYLPPQSHFLSNSSSWGGSFSCVPSCGESYRSTIPTTVMSSGKQNDGAAAGNYGFHNHFRDNNNMYFSTPIKEYPGQQQQQQLPIVGHQFLLNEIDQFLQVGNKPPAEGGSKSPENSLIDLNSMSVNEFPSLTASDFNGFAKPAVPLKPPRKELLPSAVASRSSLIGSSTASRPPLLSLNEIWNSNAINQESSKVQEERLRRQHCERNIQALQMKLLEYEQKLAVAIDVDKEKEGMILRLEEDGIRLNHQLRDQELKHTEGHEKLLQENLELKNKNLFLEKELAETISVVRKLQDRNETLESKVESLTTANRDVTDVHKNQLKDLEIRLSNSRDSERNLKEQLGKFRQSNEQIKDELEVQRKKAEENNKLRADYASLKVKTDNLSKKFTDGTAQNEAMKEQIKDFRAQLDSHMEEKKKLIRELDVQRLSLKKYYQSQLEDVVSDKLKEFQKQLASVEQQLKSEAKEKERLLAERAIKQIELINHTNEQEINLLNEKYNEQESLYRLQLTNSSKTIHELEEKLASYQNRRADIAEKLHSIMEAQWQKALKVLTSPSAAAAGASMDEQELPHHFSRLSVDHIDKDQLDGVRNLKSIAENETFQTPISSRQQKATRGSGERSALPRDLLHNYIELLLEKSPSDLKDLEGILASCRKETKERPTVHHQHAVSKPSGGMTHSTASLSQLSKSIGKTPRPWK